jgi:hypothetical protein
VKLTRSKTLAKYNAVHSADKANIAKLPKATAQIFPNKRKAELMDEQEQEE